MELTAYIEANVLCWRFLCFLWFSARFKRKTRHNKISISEVIRSVTVFAGYESGYCSKADSWPLRCNHSTAAWNKTIDSQRTSVILLSLIYLIKIFFHFAKFSCETNKICYLHKFRTFSREWPKWIGVCAAAFELSAVLLQLASEKNNENFPDLQKSRVALNKSEDYFVAANWRPNSTHRYGDHELTSDLENIGLALN